MSGTDVGTGSAAVPGQRRSTTPAVPGQRRPSTPDLEVVVVAYRSAAMVGRCLASVREHLPAGLTTVVHVVDNASGDGTAEAVETAFPWVRVVRNPVNSGFSAGNNLVLDGVRAPLVLLLNPDTELRAGVLEHLCDRMAREPGVGVMGCRLERADGTFDHASKRMFPSPVDALRYLVRRGTGGSSYVAPQVPERGTGVVDCVNGAFMLVRTAALSEVGLLDETFWMYGEDMDWCRRFARAGWQVVYDGTVTAVHLKGGTSGGTRGARLDWHFHRSMIIFYRRYDGGRPLVDLVVVTGILGHLVLSRARDVLRRLRLRAV